MKSPRIRLTCAVSRRSKGDERVCTLRADLSWYRAHAVDVQWRCLAAHPVFPATPAALSALPPPPTSDWLWSVEHDDRKSNLLNYLSPVHPLRRRVQREPAREGRVGGRGQTRAGLGSWSACKASHEHRARQNEPAHSRQVHATPRNRVPTATAGEHFPWKQLQVVPCISAILTLQTLPDISSYVTRDELSK